MLQYTLILCLTLCASKTSGTPASAGVMSAATTFENGGRLPPIIIFFCLGAASWSSRKSNMSSWSESEDEAQLLSDRKEEAAVCQEDKKIVFRQHTYTYYSQKLSTLSYSPTLSYTRRAAHLREPPMRCLPPPPANGGIVAPPARALLLAAAGPPNRPPPRCGCACAASGSSSIFLPRCARAKR